MKAEKPHRKLFLLGLTIWAATLFAGGHSVALAGHQVAQIASQLEQRANHLWQEAQDRLQERYYEGHEGEDTMMLYLALNNFANSARFYRRLADRFRDENLRGGTRSLIIQARNIDELFEHTHTFGHLKRDWKEAKHELKRLVRMFSLDPADGYQSGRNPGRSFPRDPSGRED